MNKQEINDRAAKYASLSKAEKKRFIESEKKRIESLSSSENRKELFAIKKLLIEMKSEIQTILHK